MARHLALIDELNDAVAHGGTERRGEVLARIADLFAFGAASYASEQILLFDDIFKRLVASIEVSARAALADRLAHIPNAPPEISRMLALRGEIVPLANLTDLLQVESVAQAAHDGVVIVVETSDGVRMGLVVDELCGHQQVVIKSIEENYHCIAGIAAATILGNGRVAFILDIEKLPELAQEAESQLRAAKPQDIRSVAA